MKYVSFSIASPLGALERVGVLHGADGAVVIDLRTIVGAYLRDVRGVHRWQALADALVPDLLTLIENGPVASDIVAAALQWFKEQGAPGAIEGIPATQVTSQLRMLAPIPRPVSVRDCMAFEPHAKGVYGRRGLPIPQEWFDIPINYRASHINVVGTGAPLMWPSYSEKFDFELELAVCIGKTGRNIREGDAGAHIFGYTIYNDVSARDIQAREKILNMGTSKGKNFENSNVMGPCLVTADEFNPYDRKAAVRVNGETWGESDTSGMYHSFEKIISYVSMDDTVYPGEFIGSGTVPNGCGLDLNRWLKPGDLLELEIDGIGVLRNRVTGR